MRHTPGRGSSTSTGLAKPGQKAGLAGIALLGASIAGVALTTGPASEAGNVTATTTFHAHPDSGNHGTWADDELYPAGHPHLRGDRPDPDPLRRHGDVMLRLGRRHQRQRHLLRHQRGVVPAGVTETELSVRPVQGRPSVNFYASSTSASATGVDDHHGAGPVSVTDWVEQFFPTGTTFGAGCPHQLELGLQRPSTCENWVDSIGNSSGSLPADGDITGVDKCLSSTGEVSTLSTTARRAWTTATTCWKTATPSRSGPAAPPDRGPELQA